MSETSSKNKVKWLLVFTVVCLIIIAILVLSNSYRREPIPKVQSNYSFGTLAPIILSSELISGNVTAQVIHLGPKPLLRIEDMDVRNCSSASVFLAKEFDESLKYPEIDGVLKLGNVEYLTGNTNYEIPFSTNLSQYRVVIVWCNLENISLGHAFLQ